MIVKEKEWLEEVIDYFDFYIIDQKLYMCFHDFDGVGLAFRPYENVVGKNYFDVIYQKDDLSEVGCQYAGFNVIKLPKNIESIKNHIFLLYNKEDSNF